MTEPVSTVKEQQEQPASIDLWQAKIQHYVVPRESLADCYAEYEALCKTFPETGITVDQYCKRKKITQIQFMQGKRNYENQ